MRETLYKLFEKYDDEGKNKIDGYIKDERTYFFFLILLSKLRTNNRFEQGKKLIEFLGKIMISILDYAEKKKLYEYAKNCIILSQTFFYKKDDNDEKYYLLEIIRKHKWLVTSDFWINFIDEMISQEINKFLVNHQEIKKEDILNGSAELDAKMKSKISELLFSQLLPYINNMHEFNLALKDIVNVAETFSSKYNYMEESQMQSIFGLISSDQAEIERLREDFKKSKSSTKQLENQKKNTTIIPDTYSNTKNIVEKKNSINNNINNINKIDNTIKKNDNKINNINNNTNKKDNINNNANKKDNTNKKDNIINNTNKKENTNNNTNKKDNSNNNTNKKDISNNNTNKKDNTNNNKINSINKNKIEIYENIGRSHTIAYLTASPKDNINNKMDVPEKSQNKGEGIFSNIFQNLKNKTKKEEKKDNKTEAKKDQSKIIQKKEESDTGLRRNAQPAMIKVSPENINKSANNPFGVVLKKLPSNTNKV
jgi:hypothetical protein